jgi:hypothetical protein
MINSKSLEKNCYSSEIESLFRELLSNIKHKIQEKNKNDNNSLVMELPYYFPQLIIINNSDKINLNDVRIIIYGKLIETLKENNYQVKIKISKLDETAYLTISWSCSLEKYKKKINSYKELINSHMSD